jgi:hypothetical protein
VDFEKHRTAPSGGFVRGPDGFYSNSMLRKTASGGAPTPAEARLHEGGALSAPTSLAIPPLGAWYPINPIAVFCENG